MRKIEKIIVLQVGTEPVSAAAFGLPCLLQNNGETAVYFSEKDPDGPAVTAETGWRLAPGAELREPIVFRQVELIAAQGSSEVRVLVLDED